MMSEYRSGESRDGPESCTAALFTRVGEPLQLRSFDVPTPAANETLVRVELCTLCGSDLHTLSGARSEPTPSILAHEIVGEVVAVGDPVSCDIDGNPLTPGDKVTWSICVSCFQCDRCRSGMPQKCRSVAKYGHCVSVGPAALSGGLAEFILLRSGSTIIKLPADLPNEVCCPINCATSTIAAAYRIAGGVENQRVLILGAGMLGLTAVAFGKEAGAREISVCDPHSQRLKLSRSFGADYQTSLAQLSESKDSFDLILDCSGAPDAVESACRLADIGGRVVLVGSVMDSPPIRLDPKRIVRGWLSIHGVHNYAPVDLKTAVQFVRRCHKKYPLGDLVEKTFPLSEVNQAIEFAMLDRPIRVAIRP